MKKILLLSLLLICNKTFADTCNFNDITCDEDNTYTSAYYADKIETDRNIHYYYCIKDINDIKSIRIAFCEKGTSAGSYNKKEPFKSSDYNNGDRAKFIAYAFAKSEWDKLSGFDSSKQELVIGENQVLSSGEDIKAGTVYDRAKDGYIYIVDRNAKTKSETPATDEEIAVYQQTIKELQNKIQQIEECTAKTNVGEI